MKKMILSIAIALVSFSAFAQTYKNEVKLNILNVIVRRVPTKTWLGTTNKINSMALRRSPKPGAFTATVFKMPRMLFTTSVAKASPH